MSSHASSVARRLQQYQSQDVTYHTVRNAEPGARVTLTFEKRHPILERPRIVVRLSQDSTLDDVRSTFGFYGLEAVYEDWFQRSGEYVFRPRRVV